MMRAQRGTTPKWLRRALSVVLGVSETPSRPRTRLTTASWDRTHRTVVPDIPAYRRTKPVKSTKRIKL